MLEKSTSHNVDTLIGLHNIRVQLLEQSTPHNVDKLIHSHNIKSPIVGTYTPQNVDKLIDLHNCSAHGCLLHVRVGRHKYNRLQLLTLHAHVAYGKIDRGKDSNLLCLMKKYFLTRFMQWIMAVVPHQFAAITQNVETVFACVRKCMARPVFGVRDSAVYELYSVDCHIIRCQAAVV